jgi:flagellar hook-associated protein 1 FlgK
MANIIGMLDVGRSALLTHQKSIQTTGHNIANVNTPGYTRQRVNLAASAPMYGTPGQIGDGVTAVEIQRIYDAYVNSRIQSEQQGLGRWDARRDALERLELSFDESNGFGLQSAMNEFWNAWQDLANNPGGYTERISLISKSVYLTQSFNSLSRDLQQQQMDLDAAITGAVDDVNRLAQQIAGLNQKIGEIETGAQNANDLRDQRELLLKELSQLISVDSYENDRGQATVLLGDGHPLVDATAAWSLEARPSVSGLVEVVWVDAGGTPVSITASIDGGSIGGRLDVRDGTIADAIAQLEDLAGTLAAEVNALHTAGFDLNGAVGEAFFLGTGAGDMGVNPLLEVDPARIAAAETASGTPGDNANAVRIAELQHALVMGAGTATFDASYRSLITGVGNDTRAAADYADHQAMVMSNLEQYRESISGVSLDEEMLNLIKFQHAYDAAAKLVSTVDEMIRTVMNMTG